MSAGWHWFVVIGTVGTLIALLVMLFGNRHTSGEETTGHVWDGIEELDNPLPMWWVGMFAATIFFAIPFLIYYPGLGNFAGVANWSSAAEHDAQRQRSAERFAPLYTELAALDSDGLMQDRRARQVGRRLFLNNCSTCHGVGANGAFGFPDLTDDEWIWGAGFDAIKTAIMDGRVAQMPPWGAVLGETRVTDVAHYVLKLADRDHDATRAAAGAESYATICVACHATDGTGNPLLGAPSLTDSVWLYGSSIEQISFTIGNGRSGNMPAHADILGEQRAHILAGYVYGLSQ